MNEVAQGRRVASNEKRVERCRERFADGSNLKQRIAVECQRRTELVLDATCEIDASMVWKIRTRIPDGETEPRGLNLQIGFDEVVELRLGRFYNVVHRQRLLVSSNEKH